MATLGRKRDDAQYSKLTAMTQPEATPTKRIGSEAPIGAATAGPAAGKSAAEFTQTTKGSPGSVFKRQLGGADISGITRLAEQPLLREFGEEAGRLAREGIQYKQQVGERLSKEPQYKEVTSDVIGGIAGGGSEFEKAQQILGREKIEMPTFTTAPVKEFTPMQALRGGTVESLIRKEAQGPYTTGMAGLDALLFAKKGGAGELAQRGLGLRTAAQTAADLLQGKTSGAIPGAIKGQLESLGLTDAGDLTAEARKKAEELVTSQKSRLQEGLKTGIKTKEEAYTKAPEGKESKLAQAQRELKQKYESTRGKAKEEIQKEIANLKRGELDKAFNAAYERALAQPYIPTEYERQTGQIDQGRAQMIVMQQALNDPQYMRVKSGIEGQPGAAFTQLGQEGYLPYQETELPTLGLQNVISEQDAAQYNRLQQLLGGKEITPQTITAPSVGVNKAAIQAAYQNLLQRLGG